MKSINSLQDISFDILASPYSFKVIISTIVIVVLGAANVLLFKSQTLRGLKPKFISYQVLLLFAGQYISLVIFYLKLKLSKQQQKIHFNRYRKYGRMQKKLYMFRTSNIAIAAFISLCANLLFFFALGFVSPIQFQLLMSFNIILAPLISRLVLKRKMYRHTIAGLFISSIGLFILIFSELIQVVYRGVGSSDEGTLIEHILLATLAMIFGCILLTIQRIYEEWLLDKISISSYRFVGLEGYYGIIFVFFLHAGFAVVNYFVEDNFFNIGKTLAIVIQSKALVITTCILLVNTTLYEVCGIIITRKVSATFRLISETIKIAILWLMQIVLDDIHSEEFGSSRYLLQVLAEIISFGFLVMGSFMINEIIEVRCFNLNKYFGRYLASKHQEELELDTADFCMIKS